MKMGNSYLKLKVITLKLKVVTLKLKVVTLKLKVITLKLKVITLKLKVVTLKLKVITLKLKVITLKLKVVTLKLKVVTLKLKVITFGDFLRFEECFSYSSEKGKIISFKVNDRQYLEFIEDSAAKEKKRMVSVSLEVDDVKEMEVYLTAKNVNIIGKIRLDNAGNEVIAVDDGYGNRVEFISFRSDGLHKQSQGRFLSEKRISTSIHHAGLYTDKVKNKSLIFVPNLVRPCGTRKDC